MPSGIPKNGKPNPKMKKIKLVINSLYVSVNVQYAPNRWGRVYVTKEARVYKELVGWEAKTAYKGKVITDPIKVSVWYYFKDKRRRDLGNDKLTFDALENIIYKDDSQIYELHLYKRFDKENPRTKIIITFLE